MPSPIINNTIQAVILASTSCVIGQLISAYRRETLFTIDLTRLTQFIIFAVLNSPPNFLWQTFLEQSFPSTHLVPTSSALKAASENDEKKLDHEEKTHTLLEPKLSISNTIMKFLLDQTIGAALNTLLFSLVFAGFQGANFAQAVQIARQDFWSLIFAGMKLWPFVTLVNFTLVKSVQSRQLVSGLANVGWGVYLSLIAAGE
ncbi:hypothetical protein OIDMADRAFT_17460 [Oidiodendron maius Zn]|uniref:Mpv17/PMP22 family protein n=1 Tax=Oidiodendron maius (strain Zn) TaxID=913774 RepID=A0A0C3CZA9_OIDMZ|nr:hypothetical protein OIDMADRAFT_17460 [Oidiodendron maius Zn]